MASKFDNLVNEVKEYSKQTALVVQKVDELSIDMDDLNRSISGRDGLSERVTKVETKLSERTSSEPPRKNHARLKMAGTGIGGSGLLAYVIYQLITNPPW